MDLAFFYLEGYVVERLDAREFLCDVRHFKYGFTHGFLRKKQTRAGFHLEEKTAACL